MTTLTVGGLTVESEQAQAWAAEYLRGPHGLSSYPAYDAYEGSGPDSPLLGDADLLAPVLLNVSQKPVRAYYSLQALTPALNGLLQDVPTGLALDEATEDDMAAVAALFSVLDSVPAPKQVRITTLAKVLSRKRPGLIPVSTTRPSANAILAARSRRSPGRRAAHGRATSAPGSPQSGPTSSGTTATGRSSRRSPPLTKCRSAP